MTGYIGLISLICLVLSSHSNSTLNIVTTFTETNKNTVFIEETDTSNQKVFTEKSTELSPFVVYIDKTSLELRKVKETIVFIDTELTDWGYSVQAEYGTISEKNPYSFVYTRPKDENLKKDIITIELIDGENKAQYKYVIPLNYIFNPRNIIKSDSKVQTRPMKEVPIWEKSNVSL